MANDAAFKCKCSWVRYCSSRCQKADWPNHQCKCLVHLVYKLQKTQAVARGKMYFTIATVHHLHGMYENARKTVQKALAIFLATTADHNLLRRIAVAYELLADVYSLTGRCGESIELLNKSLAINETLPADQQLDTMCTLNNIAIVYLDQDRFEEALSMFSRVYDLRMLQDGAQHAQAQGTLLNIATVCFSLKQHDRARNACMQIIDAPAIPSDCQEIVNQKLVRHGKALKILGNIACEHKLWDESVDKYVQALAIFRRVNGNTHVNVGMTLNAIAQIKIHQGFYEPALKLLKKTKKIIQHSIGNENVQMALTRAQTGHVYACMGTFHKAKKEFEQVIEIFDRIDDKCATTLAMAVQGVATCEARLNDPQSV
jgi:tetratricopeptide (TPR) repeat protein